MKYKAKIIAFYLPQFHPIPENDEWWGKGFTEWTNVAKAKPLFKGHYQPKIPSDLGFYDLRLHDSRLLQARLAKDYGIYGFCYYHYWFGNGKTLLEKPLNEVLEIGEPDFPFMLCWANESWHAKFWDNDGISNKKLLIEQKYGNNTEITKHFNYLLKAFSDDRYIKIDGKPAFMIYKPLDFPNVNELITTWNNLAETKGLNGIFFIAHTTDIKNEYNKLKRLGFDAVNSLGMWNYIRKRSYFKRAILKIIRKIFSIPILLPYDKVCEMMLSEEDRKEDVFPTIVPNWDHTPRSGNGGTVFLNSTPLKFGKHLNMVLNHINDKNESRKICFLKSWNEWGEGNYVEPDLKYGRAYLEIIKKLNIK